MTEPNRNRRRKWLPVLLGVVVAGELAAAGLCVWPIIAAKGRASPQRLHPSAPASRPAQWAQGLAAAGLRNFHRVRPGLYRGARPTPEGIASLRELGVRTVVNLEMFHSDREMLRGSGMNYVTISFKAWHPENEDMVAFLKVAADANLAPVYVHCQYGSDRTGTMCALYRIAVEGWSKQEAINEMVSGGFGFHAEWQNLLEFLDELDVEALKKRAGIGPTPIAGSAPEAAR